MGKVCVRYGKPIPRAEIAGRGERELPAEVERRVRECQTEFSAIRHHVAET